MATSIPDKIGRYQILERVGKGGMGVLYRGVDPVLDREVAIKVMHMDFSDDTEQMRPRFYREAQAAAKLQHSNIVTIFEFAEDHNSPYIVMEFLRGTPLDARMASPIPLTLDDKLNIVGQLCSALHYAHEQGVVHRDIKPANIFLLPDGTIKLLDFGVAKLTTSTLTRQGDVLGSVSYMSPEQVSGSETLDGRSDIFSVGVMLYELLGGRKPFQTDSPTATAVKILREEPPALETLAAGLPPRLMAAVRKALAKEPADRFATAGDFARELQMIRRNLQSAPIESSMLDETRFASPLEMEELHKQLERDSAVKDSAVATPSNRRWWVVSAGVGALALVGVTALTISLRSGSEPIPAEPPTPATAPQPEEVPAGAASRTLRVETTPPGASISIGNQALQQTTPASVTVTGPGPHALRLSKRGFVAQDVTLSEQDLTRGSVSYALTSAEVPKVSVTINSGYPVEVFSGAQAIGAASQLHQLSVSQGSRLRVVSREYMLDAPLNVGSRAVEYTAPGVGYLSVVTAPKYEAACTIKIGSRSFGSPPVVRQAVVSGEYRVDVLCPGTNPPSTFVTVRPNEVATAKIF